MGHSIRRKLESRWTTGSSRERSLNQQAKVTGRRVKMLQKRRPWRAKALGEGSPAVQQATAWRRSAPTLRVQGVDTGKVVWPTSAKEEPTGQAGHGESLRMVYGRG